MASKYLLDTNIVIYALGSVKSAVEYINKVTRILSRALHKNMYIINQPGHNVDLALLFNI